VVLILVNVGLFKQKNNDDNKNWDNDTVHAVNVKPLTKKKVLKVLLVIDVAHDFLGSGIGGGVYRRHPIPPPQHF
jgi:hypothetical protein